MKKTHFSPVMPLLVSFSLVLGILVSDVAGYRFLTAAHAQNGSNPGNGRSIKVGEGVALNGMAVHGLLVNGQVVTHAVIAGNVRIVDGAVANARVGSEGVNASTSGVVVGDTIASTSGVVVGDTIASMSGVVVGDTVATTSGVVVGDTIASTSGVVVGDQSPTATGDEIILINVIILNGNSIGGALTGDGITINEDGVITGTNLLLTGATIGGGSIHAGTGSTVQVSDGH